MKERLAAAEALLNAAAYVLNEARAKLGGDPRDAEMDDLYRRVIEKREKVTAQWQSYER